MTQVLLELNCLPRYLQLFYETMKESITDDLDTKNKIFSINTVITLQKL